VTLRAHLVRGVFGVLGLTVLTAGLTFINGVLLARLLGASAYGVYASAIAVVLLLGLPLTLGFERLLVRDVAAARARNSWTLAQGLIRRSLQIILPVSLISIGVLGLVAIVLDRSLADDTLPVLLLALLMIPLTTLTIVRRAVTQGLQHIVTSQLPESLIRPGLFTVVLAIAYFSLGSISASVAMALNLACLFVSVSVGVILLVRQLPHELRTAVPAFETRRWIREAIPFALIAAGQTLMGQIDIVLVGALGGATPAGLYAVATRGAALTLFGAAAVGITLAPTTAQLWTTNDNERLQRVVTRAARFAFLFSLVVAIPLWLFGPQFLLLFGEEFQSADPALAVLALSSVIDCGFGIGGLMLAMTGFQRLGLASMGTAVVIRILLDVGLIPIFGAQGAAFAALISVLVINVMTTYFTARHLHIDSTPLGLRYAGAGPTGA
jgi:O-antigen/teichoic acid export membrane protein